MARHDFTLDDEIFVGSDKILEFEVLDSTDGPVDVAAFTLSWTVAKLGAAPLFSPKTTGGGGITVVGVYDPVRETNTQRVHVALAAANTRTVLQSRLYQHALTREDVGYEDVLSHGALPLRACAAVP